MNKNEVYAQIYDIYAGRIWPGEYSCWSFQGVTGYRVIIERKINGKIDTF